MEPRDLLSALAEPRRTRMLELLAEQPRTVGELALLLDALQPQTTKHVQVLAAAGLVVVHPLGKRRIVSLNRDAVRDLGVWLGRLAAAAPTEGVLERYSEAILEEQRALSIAAPSEVREFAIGRTFAAPASAVWRAWTDPDLVRLWWSPEHFEVSDCVVEPVPGGRLWIEIREGDDTTYSSSGEIREALPGQRLEFTLAPILPDGHPLFDAVHSLTFEELAGETRAVLDMRVSRIPLDAAPAVAGIPFGWEQCFDKLAAMLARPDRL